MPPSAKEQVRMFTLIELLVVLAIIAVSAAILLPAMQQARHAAQRTVCASKWRQIGILMTYYNQDTNGMYPRMDGRRGARVPGNMYRRGIFSDLTCTFPTGCGDWCNILYVLLDQAITAYAQAFIDHKDNEAELAAALEHIGTLFRGCAAKARETATRTAAIIDHPCDLAILFQANVSSVARVDKLLHFVRNISAFHHGRPYWHEAGCADNKESPTLKERSGFAHIEDD